eukprot:597065-Pelagomonas_calceolata.AAC.1
MASCTDACIARGAERAGSPLLHSSTCAALHTAMLAYHICSKSSARPECTNAWTAKCFDLGRLFWHCNLNTKPP